MTIEEIVSKLQIAMAARNFKSYSTEFLKIEVEEAIGEINRCRRFTPTSEKLYDSKYEYLIIPMCISSLAKIGAEGQTSHTENGVVRYYGTSNDYPKELTSQIIPLIK
jgi:hypothetical protein